MNKERNFSQNQQEYKTLGASAMDVSHEELLRLVGGQPTSEDLVTEPVRELERLLAEQKYRSIEEQQRQREEYQREREEKQKERDEIYKRRALEDEKKYALISTEVQAMIGRHEADKQALVAQQSVRVAELERQLETVRQETIASCKAETQRAVEQERHVSKAALDAQCAEWVDAIIVLNGITALLQTQKTFKTNVNLSAEARDKKLRASLEQSLVLAGKVVVWLQQNKLPMTTKTLLPLVHVEDIEGKFNKVMAAFKASQSKETP